MQAWGPACVSPKRSDEIPGVSARTYNLSTGEGCGDRSVPGAPWLATPAEMASVWLSGNFSEGSKVRNGSEEDSPLSSLYTGTGTCACILKCMGHTLEIQVHRLFPGSHCRSWWVQREGSDKKELGGP